ncbi:MFS transporter [Curtobacterium sp. MCJR17_055]|uniref:MFS transporter n=1 Tax=unclassified Curtobacterium TaxID=257496 RepID=UPI000D9049FC|nr:MULTISPECIES: MFS transporter [unclassified Curtobacterium]PYY33324.1 MFS transporter [Curtobacterium sp. MCBD17_029]PYY53268.1 MFS transporter [Curtobacterium sp. MCJR17_055]PYY56422.1 MFS transporter [Curtobacterium sp. MCPF17_015]
MKRPFSFFARPGALIASGTALIAATYGLVRLAYGLFLPDVQRSLSLGDGPAGLIAAGSSLVYCVGALVGFLLAPTRPRMTVALASASAGLGVAGMATSATSAVFGVTAVVASAGAGLASPALVRLVQRDLRAGRADRAQAVVNSGTGPGLVVAGLLALVLLPDWRTAWTAAAVVTVLAGAAVLVADAYTHPRRQVREDHPQPVGLPPWSWFVAHGRLVVVALLLGTGSAAVWTYGRSLLVDAGAPASLSVLAWTALGVGGAAVALTARVLARLRARTAWTVTSAAVAVATLGLGLAPVAPPAALVALALATCVLFGWGYTAATGALIAWTTEVDAGRAASGTSVLFVVLVLGQALGAAAAGTVVATVGTGPVFAAATAVVAAAALLTVRAPAGRGTRPGPARRSSPRPRPDAPAAGGGSRARGTR